MAYLPITPHPHAEESIFSWVVRLAEANMVPSPWHIFKLAGLRQQQMKTPTLDTSKLWHLISNDETILDPFRYAVVNDNGTSYSFRGHPLHVRDLLPMKPKICPECIDEYGFASAHWDLELVTCCHVHGRRLINCCSYCGQKITWFRGDLLACQCGTPYAEAPIEKASNEETKLNKLIFDVAFRKPSDPSELNQAYAELRQVPLRYLLRFITSIGILSTQGRLVVGKKDRVDVNSLVSSAAKVLSAWPENFHNFLGELAVRQPRDTQERYGVLGSIDDFTRAVLETKEDREYGLFFRNEINKFLACTWDGPIDVRIIQVLIDDGLMPKWIPLAMAARQLKIDWRTLKPLMDGGMIRYKIETASSDNRILLRSEDLKQEWFAKTDFLTNRQAGEQLGIPVSVLEELRRTGEYVQTYFGANHSSRYAQRDVSKLKETILDGVHYTPDDQNPPVNLASAMRLKFRSKSAKADIVRAIIRGDIRTVQATPAKLDELLIHPDDLRAEIEKITLPETGPISFRQAAAAIHTTKEITKYLVEKGYLLAHENGEVDASSVCAFINSYICLNALLMYRADKIALAEKICAEKNYDLIALTGVRQGTTRRFLKKTDAQLLLSSMTQEARING